MGCYDNHKNFNYYLTGGVYYCNSKRDNYGIFQDEIVPLENRTVWLYHGNPIAEKDHKYGTLKLSSCGWHTKTTKVRLNALDGVSLSQKNYVWLLNGEEFEDMNIDVPGKEYVNIDGWRGYEIPAFSIVGASNTGSWSDSPCRPETVQEEFQKIRDIFKKECIKLYDVWKETSNVFCIHNYLRPRGNQYKEALEVLEQIDFSEFRLAYNTIK